MTSGTSRAGERLRVPAVLLAVVGTGANAWAFVVAYTASGAAPVS